MLGTIADALDKTGVAARIVDSFQGEPIPKDLDGTDGLILLGGPMGVADRDRMPFLKEELLLIDRALKEKKPILGVCLGAQLLAHALGARVRRGEKKEIGWHLVRLTEQGQADPLLTGVESSLFAYHWHWDVFDLPPGAVPLAFSEQTRHQAFRYGPSAYGFLCHLEITENIIQEMIRHFSDELAEQNMDGGWLMEQAREHLPPLERISAKVFGQWAKQISPL